MQNMQWRFMQIMAPVCKMCTGDFADGRLRGPRGLDSQAADSQVTVGLSVYRTQPEWARQEWQPALLGQGWLHSDSARLSRGLRLRLQA